MRKSLLSCELGESFTSKKGTNGSISEIKDNSNITILFENGVSKVATLSKIRQGKVSCREKTTPLVVGDKYTTNQYGEVMIVDVRSAISVDVVFLDGSLVTTTRNYLERGTVAHPTSGIIVGYSFTTSSGWNGVVTKFLSCRDVEVLWQDKSTSYHTVNNIKTGGIKPLMQPSLAGVGYYGVGKYVPHSYLSGRKIKKEVYATWSRMIRRCYSPYELNRKYGRQYREVFVCAEWHNFQNFALWAEDKLDKFTKGFDIDKDLLGTSVLYAPYNCAMLPQEVNTVISDPVKDKGSGLPYGVNLIKAKTTKSKVGYVGRCHIDDVRKYLGYFDTPDEAYEEYALIKKKEILRKAEKHKETLEHNEYQALLDFVVKKF